MSLHFRYIALHLLVLYSVVCQAAPPTLRAKLDSAEILMGRMVNLRLELEKDSDAPGEFPQFSRPGSDKLYMTMAGDSIELRIDRATADTVKRDNGRMQIKITIPVQAFDSGSYRIDPIIFVSGVDTVKSNPLPFSVYPVKVNTTAEISPDSGPLSPDTSWWQKFTDKIPDFIYRFWWLILVFICAVVVLVYMWRRYRKEGVVIRRKPLPSPYEVAIRDLDMLKNARLWENGDEKGYFTRLTDILRTYLYGRFGINAMEMTTAQILHTLSSQDDVRDKKDYVRQILDVADFVKFAKMRPLPDDNIGAFANALRFVEETKPAEGDNGDNRKSSERSANDA